MASRRLFIGGTIAHHAQHVVERQDAGSSGYRAEVGKQILRWKCYPSGLSPHNKRATGADLSFVSAVEQVLVKGAFVPSRMR